MKYFVKKAKFSSKMVKALKKWQAGAPYRAVSRMDMHGAVKKPIDAIVSKITQNGVTQTTHILPNDIPFVSKITGKKGLPFVR